MKNLGLSLLFIMSICLGHELLNEEPIHPIPQEMTFSEYEDMNRRISVALLLSAIPIPGKIHSYAAEPKVAKKIRWAFAGGLITAIAGFSLSKDGEWIDTPYQTYTVNEGQKNEVRYEMIPVGSDPNGISYKYNELDKVYKGNGIIALGAGIIFASYIYDYIYGIHAIENKRNKVRFKYGKMSNFTFNPSFDSQNKTASLNLYYSIH